MKNWNNEYFFYSMLYEDTFDATGWRLIFAMPQPTPAYATMIYFKILTESTGAKGVLLRSPERAYKEDELMMLCSIRPNDPEEVKSDWRKAFQLLVDENILEVHEDGAVKVVLSDELFGKDSRSAREKRKYRAKVSRIDDSLDEEETIEGQDEDICPEDVRDSSSICPRKVGQMTDKVRTPKFPLNEEDSSSNPPKDQRAKEKAPTVGRPSDAAAEFLQIYPKKTDPAKIQPLMAQLSEEEAEALLIAAKKVARDPSKTESNGRFAMDPLKFIKSKPWTEDDLEAARSIIWGRKQSEALEGGGDVE